MARYDYAARAYYAAIPRFDRPDVYAGKYPHISPYAFCANNPVNFTDPTGKILVFNNATDEDMDFIVCMLNSLTKGCMQFSASNVNNDEGAYQIEIVSSSSEEIDNPEIENAINYLSLIIKNEKTTSINILNSSEVIIGQAATATIDLDDIRAAGTYDDNFRTEQFFCHEVVEQYYIQVKRRSIETAHLDACQFENVYSGLQINPLRSIETNFIKILYTTYDGITSGEVKLCLDSKGNVKIKTKEQ